MINSLESFLPSLSTSIEHLINALTLCEIQSLCVLSQFGAHKSRGLYARCLLYKSLPVVQEGMQAPPAGCISATVPASSPATLSQRLIQAVAV